MTNVTLTVPLNSSLFVFAPVIHRPSSIVREKEQRHFSPDHKDARDGDLRVHGGGAAAPRPLRPGSGQTASQEGKGHKWNERLIDECKRDGEAMSLFIYLLFGGVGSKEQPVPPGRPAGGV